IETVAAKNRVRRRLLDPSPDAPRHGPSLFALPPHLPRDAPAVALIRKLRAARLGCPPHIARRYRAGIERLFAEMSREYIDDRRLRELKAQNPSIAVIMITAHTSTKSAVEALKAGAFDYIANPFDIDELKIIVRKAVERKELEDENLHLRSALEEKFTFANIIGRSA